MYNDAIEVKYISDYRLFVRFKDGKKSAVDLASHLRFIGLGAALKDHDYFRRVSIEDGALVWPNGYDICPDLIYSIATGAPLPGQQSALDAA